MSKYPQPFPKNAHYQWGADSRPMRAVTRWSKNRFGKLVPYRFLVVLPH